MRGNGGALKLDTLPKYGFGRWMEICQLLGYQDSSVLSAEWIPSHGKDTKWTSKFGVTKLLCRRINDSAGEAAKFGANQQEFRMQADSYFDRCVAMTAKNKGKLQKLHLATLEFVKDHDTLSQRYHHWIHDEAN
jgi:hypothetical protein